uniref:AbaA n=1 Tax=Stemphylium eturmiunum TaxID=235069 RepID=A0A8K1SZ34_9PLEO|nr:abaA [Stemphylium eturmiunum]
MAVQHYHPLCVPPAHPSFQEGSRVEAFSQHQSFQRESSADQSLERGNEVTPSQTKQLCSPGLASNARTQRSATGSCYTGSVNAQHIGLSGFGLERPEKQIRIELERLYNVLQRSDKYQKYREKQPILTAAEVLARDAADRKERERREAENVPQNQKDTTVWPDFLEFAFWKALVQWPPMGRKKYMLEGVLKGRNELVQDSIYRDTGITRDRKQISSHLQVLKGHLKGIPVALAYMAAPGEPTKRHRGSVTSELHHSSHLGGCQHAQSTESVTKYEHNAFSPHVWPHLGGPQSDPTLSAGSDTQSLASPFTVAAFTMLVDGDRQPMHCFTQMHPNSRVNSLRIADLSSWRRQYPEFDFLRTQAECWKRDGQTVLVCDASIKILTEARPKAKFSITLNLQSYLDLSRLESLECTTRFYDDGDLLTNRQFGSTNQELKERHTSCRYEPDLQGPTDRLNIAFGSQFWASRMAEYQTLQQRDENSVGNSLMGLTATQDVYGTIPETGETARLCTVLWRFQQASPSEKSGSMKWRSVTFANSSETNDHSRCQGTEDNAQRMERDREEVMTDPSSASETYPLHHQVSPLPSDFSNPHTAHSSCEALPYLEHLPQPLSYHALASMQPDLDQAHASASTTASDYSQHSFARPSTQDMSPNAHDSSFDFDDGSVRMSDPFELAVNTSAYQDFGDQYTNIEDMHELSHLGHRDWARMGLVMSEEGQLLPLIANNDIHDSSHIAHYSTKPNWQHTNVVSHLESTAEPYHPGPGSQRHSQTTQGHESLERTYHQQANQGRELTEHGFLNMHSNCNRLAWDFRGLQQPFQGDMGCGTAASNPGYGEQRAHDSGFETTDPFEGDQANRGY